MDVLNSQQRMMNIDEEWFNGILQEGPLWNQISGSSSICTPFDPISFAKQVHAVQNTSTPEGIVVGLKRRRDFALSVLIQYPKFTILQKRSFFLTLAVQLGVFDIPALVESIPRLHRIQLAAHFSALAVGLTPSGDVHVASNLKTWLVSIPEKLFVLIASVPHGNAFLITLRSDLRLLITRDEKLSKKEKSALQDLDDIMKRLFTTQAGARFRRIEGKDGMVLRHIVQAERVHSLQSASDLKHRLHGPNRACFGLFLQSQWNVPLVMVAVAFTTSLSDTVESVVNWKSPESSLKKPNYAVFYSVSNSNPGLQGLNLASHLLYLTIEHVQRMVPSVLTFATLSPVPHFRKWLTVQLQNTKKDARIRLFSRPLYEKALREWNCTACELHEKILDYLITRRRNDEAVTHCIKSALIQACAQYVLFERTSLGKLCDPVANFHVQNGAQVERINWDPTASCDVWDQSAGVMINYKYNMDSVDISSVSYKNKCTATSVHCALQLLDSTLQLPWITGPEFNAIPLYAKTFQRGAYLAKRGKTPDAIYILSRGTVRVSSYAPHYKSQGDVISEIEILNNEPIRYNIVAQTTCHALMIRREHIEHMLEKYPDMKKRLEDRLCKRTGFEFKIASSL